MSQTEPHAPSEARTKVGRSRHDLAINIGLLVVDAGLIAVSAVAIVRHFDAPRAPKKACEGYIRQQLMSPSTAKFSKVEFHDSLPDSVVAGDVDTHSGSGEMVRSHFFCDLVRERDGSWSVTMGHVSPY